MKIGGLKKKGREEKSIKTEILLEKKNFLNFWKILREKKDNNSC